MFIINVEFHFGANSRKYLSFKTKPSIRLTFAFNSTILLILKVTISTVWHFQTPNYCRSFALHEEYFASKSLWLSIILILWIKEFSSRWRPFILQYCRFLYFTKVEKKSHDLDVGLLTAVDGVFQGKKKQAR